MHFRSPTGNSNEHRELSAARRVRYYMELNKVVSVPKMRYIIIHDHIFKNGGSTVESILEREFCDGFAGLHAPDADPTLAHSDLAEFVRCHDGITAVSRPPYSLSETRSRLHCVFRLRLLRHPLARLHSYYAYLNRIIAPVRFRGGRRRKR
jgi:hypothetical protein